MIMDDRRFTSIGQVQDKYLNPSLPKTDAGKKVTSPEESFASVLDKVQSSPLNSVSGVRFSKHATNRLNDRNIELSADQMNRLNQGTMQASQKGIKDSLILVDQLAFIVNVPNKTVVTAMDQTENNSNIFTNIDGAVIA